VESKNSVALAMIGYVALSDFPRLNALIDTYILPAAPGNDIWFPFVGQTILYERK
jgi:hypothetical protein